MSIANKFLVVALLIFFTSLDTHSKPLNEITNFTIKAPTEVGNGAVVPININFDPPFRKGESFSIHLNGANAATVSITDGFLDEFSFRVRMTGAKVTTSVICKNCKGENVTSEVTLDSPLQTFNSAPTDIKVRSGYGDVAVLVYAKNTNDGKATLRANGFSAVVSLSKFTVSDPFFRFKGSIQKGEACFTYQSSGAITECITVSNDPPKSREKILLSCEMIVARELKVYEIEVDLGAGTVNGQPATISESEIRWGAQKTESILSRDTGVQRIISLYDTDLWKAGQVILTGKCSRIQKQNKLF